MKIIKFERTQTRMCLRAEYIADKKKCSEVEGSRLLKKNVIQMILHSTMPWMLGGYESRHRKNQTIWMTPITIANHSDILAAVGRPLQGLIVAIIYSELTL